MGARIYYHPLTRAVLAPFEARWGPVRRRWSHASLQRHLPSVEDGIANLQRYCDHVPSTNEEPVFLLGTGWRSGSTLLQRLVVSSGQVMIWGEPYDLAWYPQRLADSLRPMGGGWPLPEHILDRKEEANPAELSATWIATTSPHPRHLLSAHRSFFVELLAVPAREHLGYPRWGLKDVRFGASEIHYLRMLFPRARMVLLVRDPVSSWQSQRRFSEAFYERWPEPSPLLTPAGFAGYWNRIATEFSQVAAADPRSLFVRYEDLIADPAVLDRIDGFLDLAIDRSVLANVQRGKADPRLGATPAEARIVRKLTEGVCARFGY